MKIHFSGAVKYRRQYCRLSSISIFRRQLAPDTTEVIAEVTCEACLRSLIKHASPRKGRKALARYQQLLVDRY